MIPVTYPQRMNTVARAPKRNGLLVFGSFSVRLITLVILALLALLYVAQSSQGSAKQLKVHEFQATAEELATDGRELELNVKRAKALDTISQSVPALGLEPVDSVEHLK